MPRKIAYIVSRFPKISEAFILEEILDLERRGVDIEIFSLLKQKESKVHPAVKLLKGNVHYASLHTWSFWAAQLHWLTHRPSTYLRAWWKAVRGNMWSLTFLIRAFFVVPVAAYFAFLMKSGKTEHIHAHRATHPALAAFIIRELIGLPYSITAHSHDIYVNKSMLKEKLAEAKFIVTISEYNRTLLRQYGPEIASKIHVIHCGVDPDMFHARPQKTVARNEFSILCVASLSDYKGHKYLIDACATLKKHGVMFRCGLAGEGPERKRLESQIARLGLQEQIHILGWQNSNEVRNLLMEADVVVLSSVPTANGKQEGIPVALIEAMAMEIPVVGTTISGVPELIDHGKTGLAVPPKNAAALAAALYLIYSQPDSAQEMARIGRAKVLNEFNLHINGGILCRLFSGKTEEEPFLSFQNDPDFWQKERGKAC